MKLYDLVKKIQSAMNEHGENLKVDGQFGPKTSEALMKYDFELKAIPYFNDDTTVKIPPPPLKTTGQDADEGTEPWYKRMWASCEILKGQEGKVANAAALIQKGMPHYLEVAELLNAKNKSNFAFILGAIHFKEASCDFRGCLHNGEKIIGTGRKTTIVPKGRGPFATWVDAAVDAIGIESSRWKKLLAGSDDIGDILWALERYNGTGYISGSGRSENSPYLWACSNVNDGNGKYVSDGRFDSNASTLSAPGAAIILKQFEKAGVFKVVV